MNNLHPIASAVQSRGRGEDTQLVHMTPGEVRGLQALAKAHGGSLSVNPETGLVEAGFLKSILPTLAGAGLMMIPGMQPMGAAMITGLGATALSGGDLGKGLMAGLGAWGGAGLAGSLGVGAAGTAAAQNATSMAGAGATNAATQAANTGIATQGSTGLGTSAAQNAATNNALSQYGLSGLPQASMAPQAMIPQTATAMPAVQPTSVMDKLSSGSFYGDNAMNIGAAALPMLLQEPDYGVEAPKDTEQYRYSYNPGRASEADLAAQRAAAPGAELQYFRPSYGPRQVVNVAQGGSLGLAEDDKPFEYTYDPTTQKYTRKPQPVVSVPIAAVKPVDIDASGDYESSVSSPSPYDGPKAVVVDMNAPPGASGVVSSSDPGVIGDEAANQGVAGDFGPAPGEGPSAPSGGMSVSEANAAAAAAAAGQSDSVSGGSDDGSATAWARGGLMGLAAGGMAKGGFVVPADVVSALGNGSTDAGLRTLQAKLGDVKPIKGKGDGLSDSIPTNIDGKQPARVADGEAYIAPRTVAKIGNGDAKKGAQKLYAMMDKIRQQAHGKTTQQRKVNAKAVV